MNPAPDPDPDLSLVPTDDLVEELLGRVDHGVIALLKVRQQGETAAEQEYAVLRQWRGTAFTCAGLGYGVAREAMNAFDEDHDRLDEDGPIF